MKKVQTNRRSLIENLKQFGLDPEEWHIANGGAGFFNRLLLVNKVDPKFRLLGERGKSGWVQLELLSI